MSPESNGHGKTTTVSRDDIEAKFRELQGEVGEGVEAARSLGLVVAVAAMTFTVLTAYWLGRRRGRRRQTIVEIRRV